MRTPGAKIFSLSQFATPPTALPVRRTYGSMAEAQAHVEVCMHSECRDRKLDSVGIVLLLIGHGDSMDIVLPRTVAVLPSGVCL